MTDAEKRELIRRLKREGYLTGAIWYADAAAAIEETLWKPIADMPEELKDGRAVVVWRPKCEYHNAHAGVDIFDSGSNSWWRSRPMAQPTHYKEITTPEEQDDD